MSKAIRRLALAIMFLAASAQVDAQTVTVVWDAATDNIFTIPEYRVYRNNLQVGSTDQLSWPVAVAPGETITVAVSSYGWRLDENLNVVWAEGPKSPALAYTHPNQESPNGTTITPGSGTIYALGAVWSLTSDRLVMRDGVQCGVGDIVLWWNGSIYVENQIHPDANGSWWLWVGSGFTQVPGDPRPAVNSPPSVSVTSPANGASFVSPVTVTVAAMASDSDGTVARVDFFANGSLMGSATSAPYQLAWQPAVGSYTLMASATDDKGATSSSQAVSITVTAPQPPPNVAPSISLTSPVNGASFTAPASISIAATASDTDGVVTRVDFFANGSLISSDSLSPYQASLQTSSVGSIALTAVAIDDDGATKTSQSIQISVVAPPPPTDTTKPTATIAVARNGKSNNYTVTATAKDDVGVTLIQLLNGGSAFYTCSNTTTCSATVSLKQAGTYTFGARAQDAAGNWSDIVTKTVTK